jgi:hypothetical protein
LFRLFIIAPYDVLRHMGNPDPARPMIRAGSGIFPMSLPSVGQQAGGMNTTTMNPETSHPATPHPLSRPVEDRMLAGVAACGRDAADRRFPKK